MSGSDWMPKGSSGTQYGSIGSPVSYKNMELAGHAVMSIAAKVIENTIARLPSLKPFLNLTEFNQADIDTKGVLGFYDTVNKNIVIGNFTVSKWVGNSKSGLAVPTLQGIVAHEIGHGLSYHAQQGFRDVERILSIARSRYNRGNPVKLSATDFAKTISRYASSGSHETFAEAFADWSVNGIHAKAASLAIIRAWESRR